MRGRTPNLATHAARLAALRPHPARGKTGNRENGRIPERVALVDVGCAKSRGETVRRAQRRGAILRTLSAVPRAVAHPTAILWRSKANPPYETTTRQPQ